MALRTPLTVSPYMYIGDSTGRPLDYGRVYFGEPDKDPEFYPIDIFSDDELTVPVSQPVCTKGGYLNDNKGDMAEIHAKELIYSVKVLDQYGRKIFYKGQSMRSTWNDDVIIRIDEAIQDAAAKASQIAKDVATEIADKAAMASGFVTIDSFELGATITERNQALRHATTGKLYRWAGDLPKVVSASSTPAGSGGIGVNKWLEVSDTALRQELAASGGAALIGNSQIVFDTVAQMQAATWLTVGMTVATRGYYAKDDNGANDYLIESAATTGIHEHITLSSGLKAKGLFLSGEVNLAQMGVKGDGTTDDYPAFFKAINVMPTKKSYVVVIPAPANKYKISKTLHITRQLTLKGDGSKEANTTLLDFAGADIDSSHGWGGAIIVVHSRALTSDLPFTLPAGQVGTYGAGAVLLGIGVVNSPAMGIFLNAPATVDNCWSVGSAEHGIAIVARQTNAVGGVIDGNANGSVISFCRSSNSGKSGIFIAGSDSNAFNISGCKTVLNAEYGICDYSFLGGSVSACQSDTNGIAAYNSLGGFADNSGLAARPSLTVWTGCYAEGNQPNIWSLSKRHTIISPLGAMPVSGQPYVGSTASGFVSYLGFVAADVHAAGSKDAASLTKGKWEVSWAGYTDSIELIRGSSYAKLGVKGADGIFFRLDSDSGAIKRGRPYLPSGFALSGGHSQTTASTAPATGTWTKGAIVWSSNPVEGGYVGWVCVTAGTPGVWKGFGLIEV